MVKKDAEERAAITKYKTMTAVLDAKIDITKESEFLLFREELRLIQEKTNLRIKIIDIDLSKMDTLMKKHFIAIYEGLIDYV